MTIVEKTRPVIGGVDTHADVHVPAVVDEMGGVLGIEAFDTTESGYRATVGWLRSFGPVRLSVLRGPGRMAPGWLDI